MTRANEDRFDAARTGFSVFFGYFNEVARKIGREQAVALYTRAQEAQGAASGRAIRERAGTGKLDLKAATSLVRGPIEEGIGLTSETIEETPHRVVFRLGRCPCYEAGRAAGLDGETIEALCRSGSLRFVDAQIKQLNPRLSYGLKKMRSSPEDTCEETIVLDQ